MRVLNRTGTSQRQGQSIFNFLEWLRVEKGSADSGQAHRMADPFHLQDDEFDELWEQWLSL